jgi:hypothetical protein
LKWAKNKDLARTVLVVHAKHLLSKESSVLMSKAFFLLSTQCLSLSKQFVFLLNRFQTGGSFVEESKGGWLHKTLDNLRSFFVTATSHLTSLKDLVTAATTTESKVTSDEEDEQEDSLFRKDPYLKTLLILLHPLWNAPGGKRSLEAISIQIEEEFGMVESWVKSFPKSYKSKVAIDAQNHATWFKNELAALEKATWKSDLHLLFLFLRRPPDARGRQNNLFQLFTQEGRDEPRSCLSFHTLCTPRLIGTLYQVLLGISLTLHITHF